METLPQKMCGKYPVKVSWFLLKWWWCGERSSEKQTLKETIQRLRINKLLKDYFITFKTLNNKLLSFFFSPDKLNTTHQHEMNCKICQPFIVFRKASKRSSFDSLEA